MSEIFTRRTSEHLNRKGFTLTEIVVVMIILGLLFAGIIPRLGVIVRNSRVDTVEGNLIIFKSDMEAYIEDYGVFNVNPAASTTYRAQKITEFLNKISSDYMHMSFNLSTLVVTTTSFYVDSNTLDPWKAPFRLYFNTDANSATVGTAILVSGGPNCNYNAEGYASGDFDDDILVTVIPKIAVVPDTGS